MSKLTIVHVLSSLDTGGQEHVALNLASSQQRRGERVLVVSLAAGPEGPLGEMFRASGVETASIPKGAGVDASLPFRLSAFLKRQGADVVHTHNPHALIYGAPAGRMSGAITVHTRHGMNPDLPRRVWLRQKVAALLDAYVAVTPKLAQVAREANECDSSRLHVIPNGIDLERFRPDPRARQEVRQSLGIPPTAWVVGTVGRLAPEKDQTLLVRAMAPLLDERRQLVVVGDGPEREAVAASMKGTWRPEFCHLVGARADVERCLAAFDAFALSSKTEGLPLSLLEAMATGVPVISTSVGGIPDLIVHGVSGALVPAGDQEALFRQLLSLVSYPTAALQWGIAGHELVKRSYSLASMAERYRDLYETLRRRSTTHSHAATVTAAP